MFDLSDAPTRLLDVLDASESYAEDTSAQRNQVNLIPVLSGIVCGAVIGAFWIVGTIVYLFKRHKRLPKEAAVYAGLRPPEQPPQKYIIPPDPAVLQGQGLPGQHAFPSDTKQRPADAPATKPVSQDPVPGMNGGSTECVSAQPPSQNGTDSLRSIIPQRQKNPFSASVAPAPSERNDFISMEMTVPRKEEV